MPFSQGRPERHGPGHRRIASRRRHGGTAPPFRAGRCRSAPRRHSGPRPGARRHDLPEQPDDDLQRVRCRHTARSEARRVGIERNAVRPAVHPRNAGLCAPHGRKLQPARERLRARQGPGRGDGAPDAPLEPGHVVRRVAHLQPDRAARVRPVCRLATRCPHPPVEPVELCRQPRCRFGVPARAGSRTHRRTPLHHCSRRHRDGAPQPRPAGRMFSAADIGPQRRRIRVTAIQRAGTSPVRLCAAAFLAQRPPTCTLQGGRAVNARRRCPAPRRHLPFRKARKRTSLPG